MIYLSPVGIEAFYWSGSYYNDGSSASLFVTQLSSQSQDG